MRSDDEVFVALQQFEAEYARVCLITSESEKSLQAYKQINQLIELENNSIKLELEQFFAEEDAILKAKQQLDLGKQNSKTINLESQRLETEERKSQIKFRQKRLEQLILEREEKFKLIDLENLMTESKLYSYSSSERVLANQLRDHLQGSIWALQWVLSNREE